MLLFYICASLTLLCAYLILISFIFSQWNKQKPYVPGFDLTQNIYKFAILIPARNEENKILNCLNSLRENRSIDKLDIEIIVIDDCSEDATSSQVRSLDWDLVELINISTTDKDRPKYAHKKWALNKALELTSADYIIQLDADCIVPPDYLEQLVSFVNEEKPQFVAAPVKFKSGTNAFQAFQVLDFMGMMAFTQAGIESHCWYMANGANMIYKKDAFRLEHDGLASGDDIYAIQAVAKQRKKEVHFLKGAVVSTFPESKFEDFYHQRIRWATKNKYMENKLFVMVMAIPFLLCVSIFLHLLLIPYLTYTALVLLAISLFSKAIFDFIYLKELSEFFDSSPALAHYATAQLYHILYIAGIGTLSLFVKKYNWKNRRVE